MSAKAATKTAKAAIKTTLTLQFIEGWEFVEEKVWRDRR
jgi:hypothetical protein